MRRAFILGVVVVLGTLASAHPVSANDVTCSSFGGVIIWNVKHNNNVHKKFTRASGATVNGNLIEPGSTTFNITVQTGANVNGDIEEKGDGSVTVRVGSDDQFAGGIKEEDG